MILEILSLFANFMIMGSHYYISALLIEYYFKNNLHKRIILFFAVLLILSATMGFLHIILSFYKIYWTITMLALISALFSIGTAYYLPEAITYLGTLKSVDELQAALNSTELERQQRLQMEGQVREINHQLANEVQRLQNIIATQGWISQKQLDLDTMKKTITELRKQYRGPTNKTPP